MGDGTEFVLLDGEFGIGRLGNQATIPDCPTGCTFWSVTITGEELSVVCMADKMPAGAVADSGWRGLMLVGPLSFDLKGVLSRMLRPLAKAEISVFTISTFDTDYVFVKTECLDQALAVLNAAGYVRRI